MKTITNTLRLAHLAAAGLLAFALAPGAFAQVNPQISGDLHLRITDGKGNVKEYDLSSAAPLPIDLLPWLDLLESENGVDEIAQFAEQAMHTWTDDLMRRLNRRQGEKQSWLGVAVQPLPEDVAAQLPQLKGVGLIVRDAAPGSPAAAAGLRPNDVLTRLNEQILFSEKQLTKLIATFAPGDEVGLTWMRGAREIKVKVTLAAEYQRPPDPVLGEDAEAFISRLLGPRNSMALEMAASRPGLVIRRILQVDEQGNIQWKDDAIDAAAVEIRKRLKAQAPDLVRGFDELMLELAAKPDLVSLVNRLGDELEKADPEQRQRIMQLVSQMLKDLSREMEKK